jgi:PAS domain S-box-containing protein
VFWVLTLIFISASWQNWRLPRTKLALMLFSKLQVLVLRLPILQGKFIHVNQRMLDMTGYTQQELLQLTNTDITYPKTNLYQRKNESFAGRKKFQVFDRKKICTQRRLNFLGVELHVSPIYSPNGSIEAFSGFVIDIS